MIQYLNAFRGGRMGIEIRGMAPLLQVFDMPTSIAFYRDVLGFEVVTTSKPAPAEWHGVDAKYGLRRGLPSART
jgi:Glyoxalase/Bleomycin resistance protein/Dioxygenase superfamily